MAGVCSKYTKTDTGFVSMKTMYDKIVTRFKRKTIGTTETSNFKRKFGKTKKKCQRNIIMENVPAKKELKKKG